MINNDPLMEDLLKSIYLVLKLHFEKGSRSFDTNPSAKPIPFRLINSKYDGICFTCQQAYKKEDEIAWFFDNKRAFHLACHLSNIEKALAKADAKKIVGKGEAE